MPDKEHFVDLHLWYIDVATAESHQNSTSSRIILHCIFQVKFIRSIFSLSLQIHHPPSSLLLHITSLLFPSTSPILITLIPTRTSLSNIILSTALRTDPSLIAIDRALSVDKFGSSLKRHSCCFR
jgi:hypothetical protein